MCHVAAGDDHVSFTEFITAARSKLGVRVSTARLRKLWRESLDPEGRGRVHYKVGPRARLCTHRCT